MYILNYVLYSLLLDKSISSCLYCFYACRTSNVVLAGQKKLLWCLKEQSVDLSSTTSLFT